MFWLAQERQGQSLQLYREVMVTQPQCGKTSGQQLLAVLRKLLESRRDTSLGFVQDCTVVSRERASPAALLPHSGKGPIPLTHPSRT